MERTHTQKNLPKPNDTHQELQQSSTTNPKSLSKSKSQKTSVKSHAQLTQEVKNITNNHRLALSDNSSSMSERKG